MSFKINRSDSAAPLLPNSAAPQAKGSLPSGSGHASIFSKPLFSRAPKNSSTSMAPRDTVPLLSAEQRAAPSDGQAASARSGLMKPASSLLNRAGKAMSSGAHLVSSGMHQAGKAMSGAYQALNHSKHSGYVRLEQGAGTHDGVAPGSTAAATPQHPPQVRLQVRPEAPLVENVRPPVIGQGGGPRGTGPAPGRDSPPMPSSRLLAPVGTHSGARTGHVPQPAAPHRPAAGGAENVNPNISHPTRHAAVKKNLPSFAESFKSGQMDRTFKPQQLVDAMVSLSKDTQFEKAVSREIARNPEWGQQMQQRWNTLRNTVADARDDGDTKVPSLEYMVAKRPASFIKFMGGGDEASFAKLMRPPRQAKPAQAHAAPQVPMQDRPASPQGRDDLRPQASPRAEPAVQRPGRNKSRPADERTEPAATLKDLDRQIAASEHKGKEILHRMFNAPTGVERAAATRESYAHKAQHDALLASRNQVQARLQRVGNGAAGEQPVGRPKNDRVGQPHVQAHAPSRVASAAERAAAAELAEARAIVKKGPPDLYKMYDEAIVRVEHNNRITMDSTLIEPEDKHMESVDFEAIEKKYDANLARYNNAKAKVDAADNPERTQAQAAAFKAEVRAEARILAEKAYRADVSEAREIVGQGRVSYETVLGWAQAEARQNYMRVGSQHLDHEAVVRDYDGINQRFEAAKQLLAKPLTSEEFAARIDAQMGEAEGRVRQRQGGVGPGR